MSGAPTPEELAVVLRHIRARSISHPDSPATGHHTMSDQRWRDCVATLRAAGHQISESISAGGDRAHNQTAYTLTAETATDSTRAAQTVERAQQAVDRAAAGVRAEAAEQRRQQLARWHAADHAADHAAGHAAEQAAGLALEDRR
jgi:hypothetical protein